MFAGGKTYSLSIFTKFLALKSRNLSQIAQASDFVSKARLDVYFEMVAWGVNSLVTPFWAPSPPSYEAVFSILRATHMAQSCLAISQAITLASALCRLKDALRRLDLKSPKATDFGLTG